MKIIFLCGCLEPGRDGVGDYTRRLAGELAAAGIRIAAIAMYDRHVTQVIDSIEPVRQFGLHILRLPWTWPDHDRFVRLKAWINQENPEWLSLQFVPYSFDARGVPLKFLHRLSRWENTYRWHIMFHELWLFSPDSLKERLIAALQKFIIWRFIARLRPALINVSIPYYRNGLKDIGVSCQLLQLFGNIENDKGDKGANMSSLASPSPTKNILYFGKPPRNGFRHTLVDQLTSFCKSEKHPVNILVVSGNSKEKDIFIELLQQSIKDCKANVVDCGFLDHNALSTLMSTCTVGIGRSKPHMLGKSGSAIAMLEHGLPVWLPQWTNGATPELNFRAHLLYHDLREATTKANRDVPTSLLPEVTRNFLHQLTNA